MARKSAAGKASAAGKRNAAGKVSALRKPAQGARHGKAESSNNKNKSDNKHKPREKKGSARRPGEKSLQTDIVLPKGNEAELILTARRLGWKGLCFAYEGAAGFPDREKREEIKILAESAGLAAYFGLIAGPKDTDRAVSRARSRADLVLAEAADDARKALERFRPGVLFGLETGQKRDYMHQRNSGLNQVVAKMLAERGSAIGISFCTLLKNPSRRAIYAGRIAQNLRLAKKYRVPVALFTLAGAPLEMRAPLDLASLLVVLGLHAIEAKGSVCHAFLAAEKSRKKKSPGCIGEGIEIVG